MLHTVEIHNNLLDFLALKFLKGLPQIEGNIVPKVFIDIKDFNTDTFANGHRFF